MKQANDLVVAVLRRLSFARWNKTRAAKKPYYRRLVLEPLEPRDVPSAVVPQAAAPLAAATAPGPWVPIGPTPQLEPANSGVVTGRVSALALLPQAGAAPQLLLGSATGGTWLGSNIFAGQASWMALYDSLGLPMPSDGSTTGLLNTGSIVVDPFNSANIYVGTGLNLGVDKLHEYGPYTGNGLLISNDGGHAWRIVRSGQGFDFSNRSITNIIVDPTNDDGRSAPGQTLYISVARGDGINVATPDASSGIFKSVDGGNSWYRITDSSGNVNEDTAVINDLTYYVDPVGKLVLVAGLGSRDDAFQSTVGTDQGGVYILRPGQGIMGSATDVPWAQPELTDAGGAEIARTSIGRVALAIDRGGAMNGAAVIYAAYAKPDGSFGAILKSVDGGTTWTPTAPFGAGLPANPTDGQGWFDLALGVSGDGHVFLGGQLFVLESLDQGAHWRDVSVDSNKVGPHPDHHAFAFTTSTDSSGQPVDIMVDGNDGGVARFTEKPDGSSFSWNIVAPNIGGLSITQPYSVALNPTNSQQMVEGSQDNGVATTNGAITWTRVADGDGSAVAYGSDGKVAYAINGSVNGRLSLYVGRNGKWQQIPPNTMPAALLTPQSPGSRVTMIVDPMDDQHVIIGGRNGLIWESINGGKTWASIGRLGSGADTSALAFSPVRGAGKLRDLYVGFIDGTVTRVTFKGINVITARTPVSGPWGDEPVQAITVDPGNPQNVFVGIAGIAFNVVWQSTDLGATWKPIDRVAGSSDGGLPLTRVYSLVSERLPNSTDPVLYAGTDDGVYQGIHAGSGWVWSRFGSDLPNARVYSMDLKTYGNTDVLVAAVFGRGIWREAIDRTAALLQPETITGTEGIAPSGSVVLATVTNTSVPVAGLTATVTWGDGTTSVPGEVSVVADGKGTFHVIGNHTYSEEDLYPVNVKITGNGQEFDLESDANISDAPIGASGVRVINASSCDLFQGQIATIVDSNPFASRSDFIVSVNWGDGTPVDTIKGIDINDFFSLNPIVGAGVPSFAVNASHYFAHAGTYTVTLNIRDIGGSTTSTTSTILVDQLPQIDGLINPIGVSGGGGTVDIFGQGFTNVSEVSFGGVAAFFQVLAADHIRATAPEIPAGTTVDVVVHTSLGVSPISAADEYTAYSATTIDVGPGESIQDAINAAHDGDTIVVAAGTYVEQLNITKNITLLGAGIDNTIIQAPGVLASDANFGLRDIIDVGAPTPITVIMSGFTVSGPGPGVGSIDYGLFDFGGAHVIVSNDRFTHVRDNPLSGDQLGVAVRVGAAYLDENGTANIVNSLFDDYQKGAIVVSNVGSFANIFQNTISGVGPTPLIAQNGVQISSGATAFIRRNVITGNAYTGVFGGPDPLNDTQSCGILLFEAGSGVIIDGNRIANNDIGIYNLADNTVICSNFLITNRVAGVLEDQGSSTIVGNQIGGSDTAILVISFTGNTENSSAYLIGNAIQFDPTADGPVFGPGYGIWLANDDNTNTVTPQAQAYFNSITGTGSFAITSLEDVDARMNWWGSVTGPNPAKLFGSIDASMWLVYNPTA
jgi:hypothetical protein